MKTGIIGCGMMGSIILSGILNAGLVSPADVTASARSEATLKKASDRFGVNVTHSNREVAESSDTIILAVRPVEIEDVVKEIADLLNKDKTLISIASGISTAMLRQWTNGKTNIIRVNPNTNSLCGDGLSLMCPEENASETSIKYAEKIFSSFGTVDYISEDLFGIATAVTGCAPAYVYMFIEAMSDAAVKWGMSRAQAYRLISQTVQGSGSMVCSTGNHPGQLKDMVCSPGGTTIEGVRVLEENGFRGAIIDAISAVMEKTLK